MDAHREELCLLDPPGARPRGGAACRHHLGEGSCQTIDTRASCRGVPPGRAGGYPPGPPTDPDVRHSRIRFLRQSGCCPCAVHWPAVVRVGELKVSPPVSGQRKLCPTAPSLPWVPWASVPHVHRYYTPLRLPTLSLSGRFACRSPSRYLAGFQSSCDPFPARRPVEAPGRRQGLSSARSPFSGT